MANEPTSMYQPSQKKLAALGYELQPSSSGDLNYTKPSGSKGHYSIWLYRDGRVDFTEARYEEDFREWPSMVFRVRSEVEFDLLLWQIGWTDVEPQIRVLTEEELGEHFNEGYGCGSNNAGGY